MALTNAEMLDIVRRMRTYMSALDNCHLLVNGLSDIDDATIKTNVSALLPDMFSLNKRISTALKLIENSKGYREMLKSFNIKEDEREEEDGY